MIVGRGRTTLLFFHKLKTLKMEIVCDLYKSKTGKWYGTHTYFPVISKFELPSDEEILTECKKSYTHPEDFLIHVTNGQLSKMILPEGAYFFSN